VRALALLALIAISCGPGLAPGYRALTLGARIGQQVQDDLTAECKTRRLACEAKHAGKPDLIAACELSCLKAMRTWAQVRASYNAAAEVTWGGLETARIAQAKDAGWIAWIKPGICAIIKALDELKPILGAKIAGWLASVAAIKGVACE